MKFFTKTQMLQIFCNVLKHYIKIVNEARTLPGENTSNEANLQNGNVVLLCRFRFRFKLKII